MKDLEKIKERIRNKKSYSKVIDMNELNKEYKKPGKLYKLAMSILTIMALFLSIALYAKKDENGEFLKTNFGINIDFSSFNKTMNKLINFRSINNSLSSDQAVSNVPSYIYTGNDLYLKDGSNVLSIDDGVVSYISNEEDGYLIIVENDSGFRSSYYGISEVMVKVNDRIYFDSVLGISKDKVKIIFSKDNTKLTYEEVLGLL